MFSEFALTNDASMDIIALFYNYGQYVLFFYCSIYQTVKPIMVSSSQFPIKSIILKMIE